MELQTKLFAGDKERAIADAKSGLVQQMAQVKYLQKFLDENPEPKDADEETKKKYAERRLNIRQMEVQMQSQDDYVAFLEKGVEDGII